MRISTLVLTLPLLAGIATVASPAQDAPKPKATGVDLLGEPATISDAVVCKIPIEGGNLVRQIVWSEDGSFVYLLDSAGLLRKIAYPACKEERQLVIQKKCTCLARSKDAILVASKDAGEVLVIDPATLNIRKRIPCPGVFELAASPDLAIAYAFADPPSTCIVLDVAAGKVAKTIMPAKLEEQFGKKIRKQADSGRLAFFYSATVAPGGKEFYCSSWQCIHRFRISGTDLVYEEVGPKIADSYYFVISSDGTYLAAPRSSGAMGRDDWPYVGYGGVYVFRTSDLGVPLLGLATDACATFSFDKASARMFATGRRQDLLVVNSRGLIEKGIRVNPRGNIGARQIATSPDGASLLVVTHDAVFRVQLPKP